MNEFKLLLQNIQINFKLNVTYVPLAQELELESNGKSVAPGLSYRDAVTVMPVPVTRMMNVTVT